MSKIEDFDAFWTTEPADDPALERVQLVMAARSMIAARRALEGSLPLAFITDPVLDLLTALYVAAAEDRAPTPDDLEAATPVAPAVTRRWLAALAAEGLVETADAGVRLSAEGDRRVTAAIRAVIRSQIGLHRTA